MKCTFNFRGEFGKFLYCVWSWMMAFFYSSNGIVLPLFVKQIFGEKNFIQNVGFLWLCYPIGSVLMTCLFKALFHSFGFMGFSISLAVSHLITVYNCVSIKNSHKKDILNQIRATKSAPHNKSTNNSDKFSEENAPSTNKGWV